MWLHPVPMIKISSAVDIDVAIHGAVSMHSGLLHGEQMMSTSWVSISVVIITCVGVLMAHGQETLPSCDTSDDDHCGTPYGQLHQHYGGTTVGYMRLTQQANKVGEIRNLWGTSLAYRLP